MGEALLQPETPFLLERGMMLSITKWPMSVTGAQVGESCPGVRGGGMASLARQRHRDAMEETGAVGVGSQLGPEDTRHSLVSQGSFGNVLEGPAQNALERAVWCSISSLVLLKTEAASSPYPAPLLSCTEGFWNRMDSPLQEALTPQCMDGTAGQGGRGAHPWSLAGDTRHEKDPALAILGAR